MQFKMLEALGPTWVHKLHVSWSPTSPPMCWWKSLMSCSYQLPDLRFIAKNSPCNLGNPDKLAKYRRGLR